MAGTLIFRVLGHDEISWRKHGKQFKLRTQPQSQEFFFMSSESPQTLTIGRLAKAANIGVETVRYYQERKLLPVPRRVGTYRQYPVELIGRIRFIKRAQELGFTLDEISGLLELNDGADRVTIRAIAGERMAQIESRLADLQRMRDVLRHLIHECEHTNSDIPCPIIDSLTVQEFAR